MSNLHEVQSVNLSAFIIWPEHGQIFKNAAYDFFMQSFFTDVTLFAEGVAIPCHRIILASCSSYFDNIFKAHNIRDRPIVIIDGISFHDLLAVLSLCYKGEVQIPENSITDFMNAINMLQIKGFWHDATSSATATMTTQEEPQNEAMTCSDNVEPQELKATDELPSDPLEMDVVDPFLGRSFDSDLPLQELQIASKSNSDESLNQSSSTLDTLFSKRRLKKLPARLREFDLDTVDEVQVSNCHHCGKQIKGPQSEIMKKKTKHELKCANKSNLNQTRAKCPVCYKIMPEKNVAIHIQKFHNE